MDPKGGRPENDPWAQLAGRAEELRQAATAALRAKLEAAKNSEPAGELRRAADEVARAASEEMAKQSEALRRGAAESRRQAVLERREQAAWQARLRHQPGAWQAQARQLGRELRRFGESMHRQGKSRRACAVLCLGSDCELAVVRAQPRPWQGQQLLLPSWRRSVQMDRCFLCGRGGKRDVGLLLAGAAVGLAMASTPGGAAAAPRLAATSLTLAVLLLGGGVRYLPG
eukprot:scaffold12.g7915.t1